MAASAIELKDHAKSKSKGTNKRSDDAQIQPVIDYCSGYAEDAGNNATRAIKIWESR